MKIYNFGSDYAHQSALKRKTNHPIAEVSGQSKETVENNAGDQIQGGGEGELASGSERPENAKKAKKKKEAGAEEEQQKDLSEV